MPMPYPAYPVSERTPGIIPPARTEQGFQMGLGRATNPPQLFPPPFNPASGNPQSRELTPEEWAVGKDKQEILRYINQNLGGLESMPQEERRHWMQILSAAPLPEWHQQRGQTQATDIGPRDGETNAEWAERLGIKERDDNKQADRPPPPPGYGPANDDRPAPPPGYSQPAQGGIPPAGYRAPTPVSNAQWFTQTFGRPPAPQEDEGYLDITRRVLDPQGHDTLETAQRAAYGAQQEAYQQERAARPLAQKIGDWTRQFLQGMTFGTADELLGFIAGLQASLQGGDFDEARQFRTDWERQQQAAFTQENPVGAIATEIAGGLVSALPGAAFAARGATLPAQIARGAAVAGLEGAAYGAGTATGSLEDRAAAAWRTGWPTAAIGLAVPIAAPAIARGTAAAYGAAVHPWRTFVTGRTRAAPGVIPAERIAQAGEFSIPLTRGQATGNVTQQARELQMLNAARGDYAQQAMNAMFTSQNMAVRSAAEQISAQLADAGGRAITAREVGEQVMERLQQIALSTKTTAQRFYRRAEELNPTIAPETAEFVPQNVAAHLVNDYPDFMLDATLHPTAFAAMREIDTLPSLGRYAEGGIVPLTEIRRIQKRINALEASTPADQLALRHVREAYDQSIADMVDAQLFSGDDRAIQMLREGNQWYSQYLQMVRPRSGDQTGRFIAQIIEGNKSPEDIANWLYGANLTRPTGTSARAAERLKQIVGADSEEWNAVRGATFLRLICASDNLDEPLTARQIANNITGFVAGRGSGLAAQLYTVEERDLMRRFANVLRLIEYPKLGSNPSGTAANIMRQLAPYMQGIGTFLGFTFSGGNPLGALLGMVGQPAAKATAARIAANRAINPNAAEPFLRDAQAASRAWAAILGTANILATPRLTAQ